jgi:AcrR family transcriptional regulator
VETSPWTPFEDRKRARDVKREAVLRMAVRLFLEEGYRCTPLSRIAKRLNITKPALYNYFSSKEEILHELFRLGDEQYDEPFGRIERGRGDGLSRAHSCPAERSESKSSRPAFGYFIVPSHPSVVVRPGISLNHRSAKLWPEAAQ